MRVVFHSEILHSEAAGESEQEIHRLPGGNKKRSYKAVEHIYRSTVVVCIVYKINMTQLLT